MAIIYVKSGSTGNGSAWNNAYGSLVSALTAAQSSDEIWVSAGTYKPTTGTDRTASFTLKNNVGIYGGFAGTETARDQRNITTNVTILSGEIGVAGIADNVYHVVNATGSVVTPLTNTAILDGFTITGGNANGTTADLGKGGGLLATNANPTLKNLTFRNNNAVSGGAIYNQNGSNPILIDTLFEYNTATSNGAAIYNDSSNPQITDATFRLNVANTNGGAIYNAASSNPTIVNTVFSRNSVNTGSGGAIYNTQSSVNLINSTLSGNAAVGGGGIYNSLSTTTLQNSIVWGNQDSSNTGTQVSNVSGGNINLSNSIVQNGEFGGTNADPLFVNAKGDDLRLKSGSPALDSGNSTLLPADIRDLDGDSNTTEKIPFDLSGNARIVGTNVDLGAYEGAQLAPAPTPAASRTIFVRSNAGGSNNGTSWVNAFTDLQAAIAAAQSGDTIWVAAGVYKPTSTADRTASFSLAGKNQIEIYGGFAGTETSLSQRNVTANVTILSGDIGTVGDNSDNVYHVVTGTQTTPTTVLDGLTISGGNANGTGTNQNTGGGMFLNGGSPTLKNLVFDSNNATNGGGLYNLTGANPILTDTIFLNNTATSSGGAIYDSSSSPTLNKLTFSGNKATSHGGAIYSTGTGPLKVTQSDFVQNRSSSGGAIYNNSDNTSIINSKFILNIAETYDGGAIYNVSANNLQITNSVFSRNSATGYGGGLHTQNNTTIINSTFSGNAASQGSAITNYFVNSNIRNSIIWGNGGTALYNTGSTPTITNSIVQGGFTGTGNLNVNPQFVDAINDDFRLQSTSPAINAGNNASLPADSRDLDGDSNITEAIPFDIVRNPRINGTNVDMGAYEFVQNSAPVLNDTTLTVPENSLLNTLVGTITATDADNNPLTYSITAGNPNLDGDGISAFTINNNGQIRVADPDDINFEVNPNNPLTVTVSDGSLTDTAVITVNLTDVNETPNSPPVANDATFSLVKTSPVNTTVGTVTATDPDNNPLTYSITAGNLDSDADNIKAFSISNAGVITIADPDDISSQTNPFNLTVTVSDGNLNDTAAITVNLTNPVNRPPVVNDAIFSISKTSPNGTVVGTINATDPDNNPLTYSITAGNPDTDGDTIKAFAISNTGVITVTDANDVSAETNPFNLTIQASDGALTDTGIATVNLNNVNPLSFQLKLYEDNNGTIGSEITGNNPILGNSFFAEILVGDIRTNAAGLIINSLDFGFAADVAQNINNFADIGNVNSPLITSNFPLFRGGTLDNTNGLIDNLSGGAVPEASQGTAIGINQLSRFGLLRFNVVGTRDNSNLNLTFDPNQIGFADGTFADPNATLSLTRNIIINDAPIVGTINNVNLAERSAAGTVVVAGNLVEATDDNYGQTPTFSLSTSPKDGSGNNLFAINSTTGEITLTQAGANTIDYESGVISYQLGVKATDGYKLSTEKTFNVNITNVNEGTIVVDKTAVTFGTKLSQYRQGATDSLFVRPNFADKTQYIDITNTAAGTNDVLAIAGITINAQNVTTDANFANGDILLNPGQTRRIALTYAPKAARENFNLANGLVINSNAQNNSALNIQLTGKSTFNSDISYDGKVNLTDLNTLQRPGLFGSISGQTNYDPTADITGDGRINLAELVPFNSEFGLVI
ncbi:MAG: cadherin domain-containing protein [Microcystis sp. M54BS1]|uniref:beta strand repeat-containing protein n=1 Tax=unclassified Microcystis TaxID=2643300 RepID=UPI00257DFC42|nr:MULTISPECIES: cadherin domain-containing protein [unclassified Microcystis]MCA2538510.1 cadherin domain-containing protein [Microcystis sp. M54BS1]MCA2594732.1 cadherin domain-containing protein [Microcystis sp. M38BS1]MCA2611637.1 cadherin domain-containing protein [Microcystis sp. M27BS1]MCA2506700.1 cadherin domain-containing protein [Microcystis sp. M62BS1]MCA2513402.1 cadherin domain-containing protein [Microcystis sp. M60BS1]